MEEGGDRGRVGRCGTIALALGWRLGWNHSDALGDASDLGLPDLGSGPPCLHNCRAEAGSGPWGRFGSAPCGCQLAWGPWDSPWAGPGVTRTRGWGWAWSSVPWGPSGVSGMLVLWGLSRPPVSQGGSRLGPTPSCLGGASSPVPPSSSPPGCERFLLGLGALCLLFLALSQPGVHSPTLQTGRNKSGSPDAICVV